MSAKIIADQMKRCIIQVQPFYKLQYSDPRCSNTVHRELNVRTRYATPINNDDIEVTTNQVTIFKIPIESRSAVLSESVNQNP